MDNQQRLENLLVSKDLSTFSLLEQKTSSVGAVEEDPAKPIGTDYDEFKRWTESLGGQGVGEVIYDDLDDARDAAEFSALTGADQSITG
jgi:hypothetical protein